MNSDLTALEDAVLGKLTCGDLPALRILREQCRRLRVVDRHCDARAFWLTTEIPLDCDRVDRLTTQLGDVTAEIAGLELGMEFDLWITDGAISSFEGATYQGQLPKEITSFSLGYLPGQRRDWEYVARVLAGGID